MRRSVILIALAGLVIVWFAAVAYLAGTSTAPVPVAPQRIDIGLLPGGGPDRSATFGFLPTANDAANYQIDYGNTTTINEFYYILGRNVDDGGNATSWIYGVRKENGSFLLLYDWTGWTLLPWKEELPGERIDPAALTGLGGLIQDHRDLLAGSNGTGRQVEVYNNTYYVSVPAGARTERYAFNATTGALIVSHED